MYLVVEDASKFYRKNLNSDEGIIKTTKERF